jgi:hypothetical protein
MALALSAAFVAAFPVNRYLLTRGTGHALTHQYMHGDGRHHDHDEHQHGEHDRHDRHDDHDKPHGHEARADTPIA